MRRPEPRKRAIPRVATAQLRISMDGAYFRFCGAPQKRKGIDSLVRLCREKLDEDPFSGCVARVPEPQGDFDSVTQL